MSDGIGPYNDIAVEQWDDDGTRTSILFDKDTRIFLSPSQVAFLAVHMVDLMLTRTKLKADGFHELLVGYIQAFASGELKRCHETRRNP